MHEEEVNLGAAPVKYSSATGSVLQGVYSQKAKHIKKTHAPAAREFPHSPFHVVTLKRLEFNGTIYSIYQLQSKALQCGAITVYVQKC